MATTWGRFTSPSIATVHGRVRSVHAGFPGKASGEFHAQAKAEVTSTVERLLAERPQSSSR